MNGHEETRTAENDALCPGTVSGRHVMRDALQGVRPMRRCDYCAHATPPRGERVMTLTDFLLARIAEDEAVAQAFVDEGPWQKWALSDTTGPRRDEEYAQLTIGAARVLAECEAKRRIVEWHKSWPVLVQSQPTFEAIDSADPSTFAMRASQQMAWTTEQQYRDHFGSEPPTGPVLRLLALPYADHPDYREEWRP